MESFDTFIIARPRALANSNFKRIRFVHALALFLTYKNRRKTGTLEKKKKDFWQRIREMRRQLSFSEYRGIDLTLFAVILCIAELLIVTAARFWYADQLYTVSAVAAVVAIVLMRWGPWAGIHAVLGGLVFCFASHGSARQYFIYCAGNLFALLMLLPLRLLGGERIRQDSFLSVCFGLVTLLLMQLGRALLALLFGNKLSACLAFFTTDALSLLFTGVILWIARRLDGIFENQKHYLLDGETEMVIK